MNKSHFILKIVALSFLSSLTFPISVLAQNQQYCHRYIDPKDGEYKCKQWSQKEIDFSNKVRNALGKSKFAGQDWKGQASYNPQSKVITVTWLLNMPKTYPQAINEIKKDLYNVLILSEQSGLDYNSVNILASIVTMTGSPHSYRDGTIIRQTGNGVTTMYSRKDIQRMIREKKSANDVFAYRTKPIWFYPALRDEQSYHQFRDVTGLVPYGH